MAIHPLIALWLRQARDHAIVVLDPAGIITDWLGAAELVLGHAAEDAVGQHIALIFTEEDRKDGYPDHELRVAAEDRYSEDSRWHVRKDGTRIWVSGTVSAVRDEEGAILGFVKAMRDMTDEREHLERFQHKVTELSSGREQTHRFLNTLGHELRNPLSVLGNIEFILKRSEMDDRGRKALQMLSGQTAVLKRLADDLMDVSRMELGKMELDGRELDLRDVLESSVASMQDLAAQKSIVLEALLPPKPLRTTGDTARLQQVVLNLLTNAIKYTHIGGTVWVKASLEGNEIVCIVQDTGIGIYPPVLPQIFDLFSQASEAHDMRGGGIGVGLAMVRQIVELHGGTVQAKSAGLGKGAEFSFRLPALDARTAEG
jgi:PAS domain S-box-containing protein